KPHPAIVISNNNMFFYESAFIIVMISGTNSNDEYSFHLTNEMLTQKPKKKSQVRCHLINLVTEKDVIRKFGHIKKKYLIEVVDKIISNVLNVS
ncbi:MAG: type II toxin-antitoxin system PemK/MazF family toxin, partial [Bacteroidetes bacterium]